VAPDFLKGHLKIVWLGATEASDEMPRSKVAPESYAAYPLVILSQEGKKEIARFTADENGNYHAALPPGDYVLDVPTAGARTRSRETSTIHSCFKPDCSCRYGYRYWRSLNRLSSWLSTGWDFLLFVRKTSQRD
jgi:hypothetical protein